MNAVLERLLAQREEQERYFDQLMSDVETRGGEMVDAERNNIEACRTRMTTLDAQIEPLVAFEQSRTMASAVQSGIAALGARTGTEPRPTSGPRSGERPVEVAAEQYRTAGHFLVDWVRARDPRSARDVAAEATARLARVAQITTDTPGLLPEPIVGAVLNTVDAARPFVDSFGARPLPNGAGQKFQRPKITQHVQVGVQAAEKTALDSRQMKVIGIEFTRTTQGGFVNISRQDIDWTSPAAWDILVQDFADQYALQTEAWASGIFNTAVTQTTTAPATDDLTGWLAALYAAAALVYNGCGRLPNNIWCSMDMWGHLGALVDASRAVMVATPNVGESTFGSFGGSILNVPRIVVPGFPDGTVIVGNSFGFEYYEERIGLLSAVEPSILGVEVAYGGYTAAGAVEPLAFCRIPAPA